jgi:hypothetical protein
MAQLGERSHRHQWRSFAPRFVGAVLLFLAWLAGSTLQHRADDHRPTGLLDGGLALVAFLSASAGSAALVMGDHLFDRVEIASRWRQRRSDR